MSKKVILLFANGTEETEAVTPADMLIRAGAELTVAGQGGVERTGSHGIRVMCDKAVSECKNDDFDLLIIPGGMPGTNNIEADADCRYLIEMAAKEGKFIGAICAAPKILGGMGLLNGKKATCYPGFEPKLTGAKTGGRVVRDGNIITAAGAGTAVEFGAELIRALYGDETAKTVLSAIIA
ncbi:MAG: DJ-1/PfpI family protein [Clostridia bacterium]|nr:DJ-1/PfpI family protein [Clostridia bacterium]